METYKKMLRRPQPRKQHHPSPTKITAFAVFFRGYFPPLRLGTQYGRYRSPIPNYRNSSFFSKLLVFLFYLICFDCVFRQYENRCAKRRYLVLRRLTWLWVNALKILNSTRATLMQSDFLSRAQQCCCKVPLLFPLFPSTPLALILSLFCTSHCFSVRLRRPALSKTCFQPPPALTGC